MLFIKIYVSDSNSKILDFQVINNIKTVADTSRNIGRGGGGVGGAGEGEIFNMYAFGVRLRCVPSVSTCMPSVSVYQIHCLIYYCNVTILYMLSIY